MNNKIENLVSVGIFVLTLITSQFAYSSSNGISGFSGNPATNSGNTCTQCHSGGVAPSISVTGPTEVQPGTINTFTLTITGGQANSGGLNVSADAGTLINTFANTKLQSGEITHTQRATAAGDGSVSWDFDWQAPTTLGSYTIYSTGLSANADNGPGGDNVATMTHAVTVSAGALKPPTAVIKAPMTAQANTIVSFDGSSSSDPDGTINQYDWDFGDGNTATGALTNNTYTAEGTYTVTLTVTDNDTLTHTTFKDITIGGVMVPVANPGGPYNVVEGQVLNLDASLSTHTSAITNYIWDFGDGTPVENYAVPTVSHTYASAGSYTVTLAVQDANLITGVANTVVVVSAVAPPPPPPETDGATLYANNCATCHGPLDSSDKLNKTAAQIQAAIDANTGNMGAFSWLSTTQVQAIADALVSATPPPPPPTDGPTLYANNCAGCHGPLETSSKLNKTATQIQDAINADTGGMSIRSGLTPTEVQAIADALVTATPPAPVTDGPTLYANNCATCHGPLASSSKLNKTVSDITNAISSNFGGMGSLNSLTTSQIQAIADALVSVTPPLPPPTDGQTLYANNCEGCHGPLATSSKLNKTASQIQTAIDTNIGGMSIRSGLTPTEVQAIADALVSVTPPPAPTTGEGLYTSYCQVCHGPGGTGGTYEAVNGSTASEISSAITGVSLMSTISLSSGQIQSIADYLSGSGGSTPTPVTGKSLYDTYCLACHGPGGKGGLYESVDGSSASKISSAISSETLMNSILLNSSQIQAISDYLNGKGGSALPTDPAPTDGATLYSNNCSGCHGALASSTKLNKTATQIQNAINSNTGGMGGLSSLTPTNIQAIADALATGGGTPPPPAPADGATLYTSNCSGCHGALASSTKLNRTATQIQNAINSNTGGMGSLTSLTTTQIQAIADALAGGGTTPVPTTGEESYIALCQSCHGFNGTGGSAKAIVGVSASQITNAVASIGAMQSIVLGSTTAQDIAGFLASGGGATPAPTTGKELYDIKCSACHGPGGNGGSEEAIVNASLSQIQNAMLNVSEMQPIPLTEGEAQAIQTYLSGGDGHTGDGHSHD